MLPGKFSAPDNERADSFKEPALKAFTIQIIFVLTGFSWCFYPIGVPTIGNDLKQTESFEHTERTGAWSVLSEQMQCRLANDSYPHLQLTRTLGPLKSKVSKTLSSHTFCCCFCYRTLFRSFLSLFWRCQIIVVFVVLNQTFAEYVPGF